VVPFVEFVYQITRKNLSTYEINKLQHGKCFVRWLFTRLIIRIRKLTRSFSDTTQLVNKNRTRESPMIEVISSLFMTSAADRNQDKFELSGR